MEGFSIAAAILVMSISIGECARRGFPEGFLFGAGSSAYQMEGAWDEDVIGKVYEYASLHFTALAVELRAQLAYITSHIARIWGKSPSFWDHWTHEDPSRIADGSNADVSCDFYHKYKEDIQLMKDVGLDAYRFSISWARILPTGRPDVINWAGIRYYKSLLKELLDNGIQPYVTLYHWDHPQVLEEIGGWTNETMTTLFVEYARIIFTHLGPWMQQISTINQIFFLCNMGYAEESFAPGLNLGIRGELQCVHNMIRAHVATYRMYDKEFRQTQRGKISTAMSIVYFKAENKLNLLDYPALDYAFLRSFDHIVNPLVHGDYSLKMKLIAKALSLREGHLDSLLPSFTAEEILQNKGSLDKMHVNFYYVFGLDLRLSLFHGLKLNMKPKASLKERAEGLRWAINKVKKTYRNPEIIITENGMGDSGVIEDHERIEFFQTMLEVVRQTIYKDKCNVNGYLLWSFLDGFEYVKGYTEGYGIIGVNHSSPDRNRTVKLSAKWWTEFLNGTRDLAAIDMSKVV